MLNKFYRTLDKCLVACFTTLSIGISKSKLFLVIPGLDDLLEGSLIVNRHIFQIIPSLNRQEVGPLVCHVSIQSPIFEILQVFITKLIQVPISVMSLEILYNSITNLRQHACYIIKLQKKIINCSLHPTTFSFPQSLYLTDSSCHVATTAKTLRPRILESKVSLCNFRPI